MSSAGLVSFFQGWPRVENTEIWKKNYLKSHFCETGLLWLSQHGHFQYSFFRYQHMSEKLSNSLQQATALTATSSLLLGFSLASFFAAEPTDIVPKALLIACILCNLVAIIFVLNYIIFRVSSFESTNDYENGSTWFNCIMKTVYAFVLAGFGCAIVAVITSIGDEHPALRWTATIALILVGAAAMALPFILASKLTRN